MEKYQNIKCCKSLILFMLPLIATVAAAVMDDNQQQFEKRQPIPLPRIGRSTSSSSSSSPSSSSSLIESQSYFGNENKRQSLIPAPRIGRRDPQLQSEQQQQQQQQQQSVSQSKLGHKMARSIDCSNNPDLCENFETVGMVGVGNGATEDLMEPLDIQLRAAFIPRLGKRSSLHSSSVASSMPSSSSASLNPSQISSAVANNEDLIDIYRPGTVGGKIFGFIPRFRSQQSTSNLFDDSFMFNSGVYPSLSSSSSSSSSPSSSSSTNSMINENDDDTIQDSITSLDNADLQRILWYLNRNQKRAPFASPYTPRIGRAIFAPRIGKKAASFVPRIG